MLIYLELISSETEKNAFEEIYSTYRDLMFYVANRILAHERDAEDAVHNAFIKIAEHIEKISDPVCPKTRAWVVIIVERQAINLYKKRKRQWGLGLDEDQLEGELSSTPMDRLEEGNAVARAIAALPVQYREPILLKYDQGFDDREIGAMLDLTPGTVAKRIQRGKRVLKELLEGEGVEV